jgi:hypothetical protein
MKNQPRRVTSVLSSEEGDPEVMGSPSEEDCVANEEKAARKHP